MPKIDQRSKLSFYEILRTSASVLVLSTMAFASPALAQTAVEEDEDIVVTGIRQSLSSSLDRKRDSDVIVDSVTAVDIGSLPDRSVAETLQRIPGVTLSRTNSNRDPVRLTSEGGDVFVRGLSFVRSETNGRDVFSASNGRGLSFEDISSDLLAGVDVYKSPSADLIEGGIGGTVNLRTRLPFDAAGRVLAASVDYTYGDLLQDGFTSFNGFYSNRWETGDGGEIGLIASYSRAENGNRSDTVSQGGNGGFQRRTLASAVDGLAAGTEVWVPGGGVGWRSIENRQEREAYYAALQIAPTTDLTFTVQALYATSTPTDYERAAGKDDGFYNENDTRNNYEVRSGQNVLVGGVIDNPPLGLNNRSGRGDRSTGDYSIGFRYTPDGPWTISGDLQYIESTADFVSMSVGTAYDPNLVRPTLTFDLSSDDPHVGLTSNPTGQGTQANYTWAWGMDHLEDNDANQWAGRLDAEYAFDDDSFFRSFKFGVRATQREAVTRQTGYNWALLSQASWGNDGRPVTHLNDTQFPQPPFPAPGIPTFGPNAGLPAQSELYGFDDFFHGDMPSPSVGWFATESLVSTPENAYSFLRHTYPSNTWGWVPLVPPGAYEGIDPRQDNAVGGVNRQLEDTTAYYGVLRFGGDENQLFGVPFDGNIGVRVVETRNTARGRLSVTGQESCVATPVCVSAQAFAASGRDFVNYENSYTNTLPSLNLRFHVTDDVQLRLGASQALVRPSFAQMTPFATLNFDFQGNVLDPTNPIPLTGTAGNPSLEPTIADQLDASLEWYFAPSASFTFAAFHKAIEDYVVIQQQVQSFTSGGQTFDFTVGQQTNANDGTLQGFEVAYQQFFDFLPGPFSGFGVQANYTYIDNEGGANTSQNAFDPAQVTGAGGILPLEGMSPTSYNVTGMYEKYGVSARLTYNWRERYLVTTSAANHNVPEWWEDYGQLDGSIFYNITDNVKIGLQGQNLLGTRTFLQMSSNVTPPISQTAFTPRHQWSDTDTRYTFSLRAQF